MTTGRAQSMRIKIAPRTQQYLIVAKLEKMLTKVDKCKERLEKIPAILKRFRQAALAATTNGTLTNDWRLANPQIEPVEKVLKCESIEGRRKWGKLYKKIEKPNLNGLHELPLKWEWVTWETILSPEKGSFRRGPFGSALKKENFIESGYKVYEQYCPINDDCSFARYYISKEKFIEMESFAVKARDFLISCSGVTLGRITQVPDQYEEGIINQALLRVRIDNKIINDNYFKYLFRSPYFQNKIFESSTGSAIPNVKGVKELKAIPLPLPPIDEQIEICLRIKKLLDFSNQIEARYQKANEYVSKITQSILAKAFRGDLVPQDPSDPPASELLKQIKVKREKHQAELKAQKNPKRKAKHKRKKKT